MPFRALPRHAVALVLLATLARPVQAQGPALTPAAPPAPRPATGGHPYIGSVHVVTRDQVAARGYAVLTDVLRDVPGLETVEQYFSEVGTAVAVRGLAGNNAIVLRVNGMRVNPPGDEELPLRRDVSVRGAERIEIRYGPGTLDAGQNAVSAVIDITTRDDAGVEALAAAGTLGTVEAWARAGVQLGVDSGVRLTMSAHRTQATLSRLDRRFPEWWAAYPRNASASRLPARPDRDANGTNLFLRLEGGGGSVQAWLRESARSSGEGGLPGVLYLVPEGRWRDRTLGVEGRHAVRVDERVTLASAVTYNRYEVDPETRYVFPVAGALFLDDFKYALGSSVAIQQQLSARLSPRVSLGATVAATFFEVTPKATIPGGADPDGDVVRQAGVLAYYTRAGDAASRVEVPRATHLGYRNLAGTVQAQLRPTEALHVSAGARVDANSRFTARPFSPRLAVRFAPAGSRVAWHYAFAQGFVSPGPYYGFNVYDNGVQLNVANPDLQPERARSHEAGATWRTDALHLAATAFANRHSNLFLIGDLLLPANLVLPAVWTDAAGTQSRLLTRTVNGGQRTVRGVDLSARLTRPWGEAWASYGFVDVTAAAGTAPGPAAPSALGGLSAHNVRAGVTWRAHRTLTLTPSVVLRSTPGGVATPGALAGALETPYEVNAHLRWQPRPRWELFAQARNLTDHRYALRGILSPAPQEGRLLTVGVRAGR